MSIEVCNKLIFIELINLLRVFNFFWRGKVLLVKCCKKFILNFWDVLYFGDWGGGFLIVVVVVVNFWDILYFGDWGEYVGIVMVYFGFWGG